MTTAGKDNLTRVEAQERAKLISNVEAMRDLVERGDIISTGLNPLLGYEKVAEIVKTARSTGRTVREVILKEKLLSEAELDKALDVMKLTKGGVRK